MAGYFPAQQGETGRDHPGPGRSVPTRWPNCGGLDPAQRWQPNKRSGRVLPGPLGRVHLDPRGSRWNMWYRRASCNQTPKKKEVICEKYRRKELICEKYRRKELICEKVGRSREEQEEVRHRGFLRLSGSAPK